MMKTVRLLDNSVEIVDRLHDELIVAAAYSGHRNGLRELSYARKVDHLLMYLDKLEAEIKREIKQDEITDE